MVHPPPSLQLRFRSVQRTETLIRFGDAQIAIGTPCLIWIAGLLSSALFIREIAIRTRNSLTAAVPALHIYFFGFVMMAFQYSGQLRSARW